MLLSECCDARMVNDDTPMCSKCKEWADFYDDDEEEEDEHKEHCKKNSKWSEFLTFIKWGRLKCTCKKYKEEEENGNK